MASEFAKFCKRCREALSGAAVDPLERVRSLLAELLSIESFVQATCGPLAPTGLHLLFEDGPQGFQVLAHVNARARVSPPHDHGDSWAIYGQAIGYTDMTVYHRLDDRSDPAYARLEVAERYRLCPGDVGVYPRGVIHSIDYPAGSRFIRVTGTNLDKIERQAFDMETGAIRRAQPQQAS